MRHPPAGPLLPGLLLACLCIPFGPAAAGPGPRSEAADGWHRVDTDHFILFSSADTDRTAEIGAALEQLRQVLARTFSGMEVNSPLPTYIYLFRDAEAFRPYRHGRDDEHRTVSGYFLRTEHGNYVALDAAAGRQPFSVVCHEYLHYFLENNVPDIPLWMNEGLAEFFSTFRPVAGGAEIGHAITDHIDTMAGQRLFPLGRLFAVDSDSPLYTAGGEKRGLFYAQSWALTHYLVAGRPGGPEQLGTYLTGLAAGDDPQATFLEAFGIDPYLVGSRLAEYLDAGALSHYRVDLPAPLEPRPAPAATLTGAETEFRLGDLLAHQNDVPYRAAEAHLLAAIAIDPDHAGAHLALARLAAARGRTSEAAGRLERAIALDPDNAAALSAYGWMILERHASGRSDRGRAFVADMTRARELFRRSLQQEPDRTETLIGLGKSFVLLPDPAPDGIAALERAATLLPARDDLVRDLILVLAATGEIDRARDTLDRRLRPRNADPDLVRETEQAVVDAALSNAVDRFNAGDSAAAIAALEPLVEWPSHPRQQRRIREEIESLRGALQAGAEVDRFNQAVEASQAGDLPRALALFEQLAREATHPEIRRDARAAADDLARTVRHNGLIAQFNEAADLANAGRVDAAIDLLEALLTAGPDRALRRRVESALQGLRDR